MSAASWLPIAAWSARLERATRWAASAVEFAATIVALGSLLLSHVRHCAIACGYERTVVMSASFVPGFTNRLSEIGRSTSRWIRRSDSKTSVSSVTDTEPSIEFSIGTTPTS